MGLLTTQQSLFVNKMSQLFVSRSSNSDSSKFSDDSTTPLAVRDQELDRAAKRMFRSKDVIDKRLIKLYKVRKARQNGLEIGLNGIGKIN